MIHAQRASAAPVDGVTYVVGRVRGVTRDSFAAFVSALAGGVESRR